MKAIEFLKSYWRFVTLLLILLGLFGWTLFKPTDMDSIKSLYQLTLAVLATILTAHLAEAVESRKAYDSLQERLERISQHIPTEHLYQFAEKYPQKVPQAEVQEVWYELCAAMTKSYCATNYCDLRSMYNSRLAEAALAIQKARIQALGLTISKVFMVDSPDEITRSKEIRDQIVMGINVKWILRSQMRNDSQLESIDFAIFDDKVVLAWELDKSRQIIGAWLRDDLRNKEQIDRYKRCFTDLVGEAHSVTSSVEHDIILRRTTLLDAKGSVSMWARFRPPFQELNYALDETKGWLPSYASHSGSHVFGLYEDQRLIGFSILDVQPNHKAYGDAEFYVAIENNFQNRGFGEILTSYTMAQARSERLNVFLRVRKNHPAAALYERCGFEYATDNATNRVEVADTVNDQKVEFHVMKLRTK